MVRLSNFGSRLGDLREVHNGRHLTSMRPCELHRPTRRALADGRRIDVLRFPGHRKRVPRCRSRPSCWRSVSSRSPGAQLKQPPVVSPVPSPRSSSVEETTHPHTGTTLPGSTEEGPSVAQLKAWLRAVEEEAAGRVRGITWTGCGRAEQTHMPSAWCRCAETASNWRQRYRGRRSRGKP